jgi:L-rhamnose mutarotase
MPRTCFLLKVRPDKLDEYKRSHQNVWPEMLEALRETGWKNYSLFLRDDGLLIGYVECDDFQKCLDGMAGKAINEKWQREMSHLFEKLEGARPDQMMFTLPEVFHLD